MRFTETIFRKLGQIPFHFFQNSRIFFFRTLSSNRFKGHPTLNQPLQTAGNGRIEFTGCVNIGVFPSPFFFSTYAYIEARNKNASVSIGHDTWINNNFTCIAEHKEISIGNNVLIGTCVEIFDSDFHGLNVSDRMISKFECAKSVIIEDDVFIGSNVKILKGVRIGRGTILANGSIVLKDIPPFVIAGGNPTGVIRKLDII